MLRRNGPIVLFLCFFICVCNAQERDPETGYFLVEEEKFTPPEKAIIEHYQGRQAMAFMANDMTQTEQYLGDYVGKKTLLWFWKTTEFKCLEQIEKLNSLAAQYPQRLGIVSFADDTRAEMEEFLKDVPVDFPIIPNASIFGEGAYASDLGYPRMFILDSRGKIQKILPASFFENHPNTFEAIKGVIEEIR